MSYSDETLMAYVDGELDAPARAAIDRALAGNAELARRMQAQRRLREQLTAAFDPVLDEPLPARLLDAAQVRPPSKVVELAEVRARRRWRWPEWGAMAASVLFGVFGAQFMLRPAALPIAVAGGALVARDELDTSLAAASEASADSGVRVGLSFVAKSGEYCRAFTLSAQATAGLACRRGERWQVELLARDGAAASGERYRQAGSALPEAVLRAVDERISGDALDAAAERAAAARGWRR